MNSFCIKTSPKLIKKGLILASALAVVGVGILFFSKIYSGYLLGFSLLAVSIMMFVLGNRNKYLDLFILEKGILKVHIGKKQYISIPLSSIDLEKINVVPVDNFLYLKMPFLESDSFDKLSEEVVNKKAINKIIFKDHVKILIQNIDITPEEFASKIIQFSA